MFPKEMNRFPMEQMENLIVQHIMFNSRVSSQKLGATDTALCSPSFKS